MAITQRSPTPSPVVGWVTLPVTLGASNWIEKTFSSPAEARLKICSCIAAEVSPWTGSTCNWYTPAFGTAIENAPVSSEAPNPPSPVTMQKPICVYMSESQVRAITKAFT